MTGAETGLVWRREGEGRKSHLEKSASCVVFCVLLRGLGWGDWGRGSGCHEEFAVVLFVQGDGVGSLWVERGVCAGDESAADGYFGGETDEGADYARGDEGFDCVGDVARVYGVDGAEDDQDFAGTV